MSGIDTLNGTYVIDPSHTRIGFVVRHAMVTKVRGSFNEVDGKAVTGENLQDASIDVTIDTASVDTRNADRDGHLKSADVQAKGDDLVVTGDLTIKDLTKSITIEFEYEGGATDPFGNQRVGFEGKTVVNRAEYGLTWNAALETGGVLVSDKVTLEFEISAIRQA